MCLAIPAKIVELNGQDAVVEVHGVRRRCNVAFVDQPRLGDYVLVHAGFAIRKWSEADLREYEEVMSMLEGTPEEKR